MTTTTRTKKSPLARDSASRLTARWCSRLTAAGDATVHEPAPPYTAACAVDGYSEPAHAPTATAAGASRSTYSARSPEQRAEDATLLIVWSPC